MQPRFLTLAEAAEVLGISIRAVNALVRDGNLEGVQSGGRNQWRVTDTSVWAYKFRRDDDDGSAGALVR